MSWFAAARARLHLLFAPRAAAARSKEEIDFHIAMETERLVREQRLAPDYYSRASRAQSCCRQMIHIQNDEP